jgi:hypothetical protein
MPKAIAPQLAKVTSPGRASPQAGDEHRDASRRGTLAFGAASQALGLLGLFSKVAFADVNPAVLALENLWLITVAVTLLVNRRSPKPQPVIAQPLFKPTT